MTELRALAIIVSTRMKVLVEEVISPSRKGTTSEARQLFCYLAYKHTKHTQKEIGAFLTNRHHSSIYDSIRKCKNYIDTEPKLRKVHKELVELINLPVVRSDAQIFERGYHKKHQRWEAKR